MGLPHKCEPLMERRGTPLASCHTERGRAGIAMLIKSITTPDVKFCGPDVSLGAVSRILAKHGYGIVPVVDGQQKVIGVRS